MKTEHTPIPWAVSKTPAGKPKIVDGSGFSIATMPDATTDSQANAAVICRAVNSYADMLAALEMVASQAGFEPGEEYGAAVIAAIRRAKGEG